MEMRPKRQHTRNMGYGGVTNATLRSKNQLLQQQQHAHRVAGCCCCLGAGLLLGGRIVAVLCANRGNETCTLYEEKSLVCIQTLRTYAGIGDAETQSPGMLRKPGDLPYMCPRPKKFKRLATPDTLHGSRPNLRQREPDGRIVPTPPDVRTKVRARRDVPKGKKKSHLYIYI